MRIIHLAVFMLLALCKSIDVHAAEIDFTRENLSVTVTINGDIAKGDYDKFEDVLVKSFAETTAAFEYNMMVLEKNNLEQLDEILSDIGPIGGAISLKVMISSNGGDLSEAMKIGRSIREMLIATDASVTEQGKTSCASACFFIWVSGIEREAQFHNGRRHLGIHRLYFRPDDYKTLSATDADRKYTKAKIAAEEYLQEMGVPSNLIHKSFTVSSQEVYLLSEEEINILTGTVPYYDELLISKCGAHDEQEKIDTLTCNIIYPNIGKGNYKSISKAQARSIEQKCKSLSPAYLKHIHEAYLNVQKCRNKHNEVERWKRMANYLGFSHLIPGNRMEDKYEAVSKSHPGSEDLVKTHKFNDRLDMQPKPIKDLADSEDINDAIKLIDLYKSDGL